MPETLSAKQNNSQAHTEEALLSAAFNSSESVIFIVEPNGDLLHFNRKAYENSQLLHGRELKRGDSLYDYARDPTNDVETGLKACLERVFAGETFHDESEVKFNNDSRWFKSEYIPIFEKRKIIAASIHIHEVTEQKLEQLSRERLLADIQSIYCSRMSESKILMELIINHAKQAIKSLGTSRDSSMRRNLLSLMNVASELRSKINHWKKS